MGGKSGFFDAPFPVLSVGGLHYKFRLRMMEGELSQPVKMTGAHPGEPPIGERQMAVGVQAGGDTQCASG
jgi:hypothetical protein